ncbi:MAG: hypothetical protein F9K38_09815 [Pseudorhodoplanes sp.]|nr:MAG: hypothetical protein F9K38_09815 [Pseudorhodoplanes sp.]
MKRLVIAMSLLAASATLASAMHRRAPVDPETVKHKWGATIKAGNKCWANIDSSRGFGFWDECDSSVPYARALSTRERRDSGDGGGSGGGGGGGGGGR